MCRQFRRIDVNILYQKFRKLENFVKWYSRADNSRASQLQIWNERAARYGVRGVLNIGHREEEVEEVTQMQKEKIFPHLVKNDIHREAI